MERRGAHTVIHSTETLSTPRGGTPAKTGVERIAERAYRQPEVTFTTLMHPLSVENLRACFEVLDGKKALGVDGVTKAAYGHNLEANLQELHRKLHQMSYRPQPV